ncbi:hypothetical protein U0355_08540 [Salimicrobium sp. PL1-032A]|uniref:hypothetical protein n=1 Tax=Salimicrobium sp. PL1-032A TaxID=3095364 RepID=UPI00326184A5
MTLLTNELVTWMLFLMLLGTSYMSYQAYKENQSRRQFILGFVHLSISPFFASTIGPVILGIGLIQLYMSTIQWKNKKAAKRFSRL